MNTSRRRSVFLRVLVAVIGGGLVAIAIATASILVVVGDAQDAELAEAGLQRATVQRDRLDTRIALARAELRAVALAGETGQILDVPGLVSGAMVAVRCTRGAEELVVAASDEGLLERIRGLDLPQVGSVMLLDAEHALVSIDLRELRAVGVLHLPSVFQRSSGWQVTVTDDATELEASAMDTGSVVVTRLQNIGGEDILRAVAPSDSGVHIIVEAPTAPARQAALAITRDVVVVSLIAILPLFIVALILSRAVTSPVRRLAEAVREGHGGVVALPRLSKDEIGELGVAIRDMSRKSYDEAQSLRATLSFYRRIAQLNGGEQILNELERALSSALPNVEWSVARGTDLRNGRVPEGFSLSPTELSRLLVRSEKVADVGMATLGGGLDPRMQKLDEGRLAFALSDEHTQHGVVLGVGEQDESTVRRAELLARAAVFGLRGLELLEAALANERLAVLGRLSASLAHELNNPLAFVTANLNLLEEELEGDQREAAVDALVGAERLRRIVDDLSSATRGPINVSLTQVDATEVVEQVTKVARTRSPGVKLSIHAPRPIRVYADQTRLEQVLLNLVTNAIDAASPRVDGGTVTIAVATLGDKAVIRVTDNGSGVPDEVQDRLFDAFFTTKGQRGTGLGLFLARQYIEAQEGMLELESTSSRGTTFRIEMGLAAGEDAPRVRRGTGSYRRSTEVLIVDDELAVVRGLERWLGRHVRVTTTTDPHEALELAKSGSYSLVLCDVHMPELTGPQLVEAMLSARPELVGHVALMTGSTSVQMPGVPVLRKPIDKRVILDLLEAAA